MRQPNFIYCPAGHMTKIATILLLSKNFINLFWNRRVSGRGSWYVSGDVGQTKFVQIMILG